MDTREAEQLLADAEQIVSAQAVQSALRDLAQRINSNLAGQFPLVLPVMTGASVFCGQLLPLLTFPLALDYLHVSRYGAAEQGGALSWKSLPEASSLQGRSVLVVDDILDAGETLQAIRARLLALGAARVYSAVFAEKQTGRIKPVQADFVGLELPDRFVFGYGMDIRGVWRNLPAIYALKEQ